VKKLPDERGRLRCERLGLSLAPVSSVLWKVEAPWLRWFDSDGRLLPMPQETAGAEAERANAEAERANAEAERANRLAAEIEALKRR
jgi:hypothetical protein